jgi:RNA polymerase sigma-70 factor (ECF subfamily)
MPKFRPKEPVGDVQAVRVSFDPSISAGEGQAILKLEERVIALFDELRLPLYRYLLCMGVLAQDAEELIQDVFLKLYKYLHSGGADENLRGWMFRVAHNAALDRVKGQKFMLATSEEQWAGIAEKTFDPSPGPEELLMKKEKMKRMHAAMAALSPQQRQCLHLRMEGFRYRDIAGILGVTVPTVGESLRRAMVKVTRESNE